LHNRKFFRLGFPKKMNLQQTPDQRALPPPQQNNSLNFLNETPEAVPATGVREINLRTKRNGELVVVDPHLMRKDRTSNSEVTQYWRCVYATKKGILCKARGTSQANWVDITMNETAHTCEPNPAIVQVFLFLLLFFFLFFALFKAVGILSQLKIELTILWRFFSTLFCHPFFPPHRDGTTK
jgi:hypothetical protein